MNSLLLRSFFFLCCKISPTGILHYSPIGLWIRLRFFLVCDGVTEERENEPVTVAIVCHCRRLREQRPHPFPKQPQPVALVDVGASCLFPALRQPKHPVAPHGGSVSFLPTLNLLFLSLLQAGRRIIQVV